MQRKEKSSYGVIASACSVLAADPYADIVAACGALRGCVNTIRSTMPKESVAKKRRMRHKVIEEVASICTFAVMEQGYIPWARRDKVAKVIARYMRLLLRRERRKWLKKA